MPHMRPASSSRRTAVIAALGLSLLLGLMGGAARAHAHPADRPGTAPPQYTAARDAVVRDGRAAARLIAAGEAARLDARFTPQLAARVPLDRLEALLRDTRAAAPVGAREGETALPLAPGRRIYIADHAWDGRTLGLTVAFDARARIGSLLVAPREPLAADPAAGAPAAVLRMPVDGTWWTFWGGPAQRQNHHVQAPTSATRSTSSGGATAARRAATAPPTPTTTRGASRSPRRRGASSSRRATASATTGRRSRSRTGTSRPATT